MHVGIIRGDMPGAVLLDGLEPVSQHHASVDPRGQEVYVSRPTVAEIEAVLADATVGAGAVLNGSDISGTFPITVVFGVSDDLKLRTSATPTAFVTYSLAAGAYGTLALYVAAVNLALGSGSGITCRENVAGNGIALESDTKGVDSFIENDNEAGGSNANVESGLADGVIRTMVPAATLITDTLPVGGPLDVSPATINGSGAGTNSTALAFIPTARGTATELANAVAPKLVETPVAVDSYRTAGFGRSGQLAMLINAVYTPDPNLLPAGAAIEVVEDDGTTPFGIKTTVLTSATLDSPGAGDVTLAGFFMAAIGSPNAEREETTVKFSGTGTPAGGDLVLSQALIVANGGIVTATSIVIPAVLNTLGLATTTTTCQVKNRSQVSAVVALV